MRGTKGWDRFLSEQDQENLASAGYGSRVGFGERPALLIVDATYSFTGDPELGEAESVRRWRNSCVPGSTTALPVLVALHDAAAAAGIPVVYTRVAEPRPDLLNRGRWRDKNRRTTEDGTVDAQARSFLKAIEPRPSDIVIDKEKPSAFFGTPLVAFLTDLKVDTLLVCGVATSGCIRATVIDGFSYNYRVSVVEDATFDRSEASHWVNLFDMNSKYADVVPSQEVLSYIRTCRVGEGASGRHPVRGARLAANGNWTGTTGQGTTGQEEITL